MNFWLASSLILAVTAIYLIMIEFFSVAFKLTGLATNKIRFQVASLFTGAGFTTQESEIITNDNRRRRIAVVCMYTGHIFSVVIMGLIINVLISIGESLHADLPARTYTEWYFIVFYISSAVFILVLLIKIPPINKKFQKLLEKIAINTSKARRESNIITVLDYYGRSAVVEIVLNKVPEFAKDKSLGSMALTKKYALILLSVRYFSNTESKKNLKLNVKLFQLDQLLVQHVAQASLRPSAAVKKLPVTKAMVNRNNLLSKLLPHIKLKRCGVFVCSFLSLP